MINVDKIFDRAVEKFVNKNPVVVLYERGIREFDSEYAYINIRGGKGKNDVVIGINEMKLFVEIPYGEKEVRRRLRQFFGTVLNEAMQNLKPYTAA